MAVAAWTERAMTKWGEEEKAKLHPRIRKLITLALYCLWHGPDMRGQSDRRDTKSGSKVKWPGWDEAIREIREAVEGVGDVWVDTQAEIVMDSEPEPDVYEDVNPDYDPDDPESEEFIEVTNYPEPGDIVRVDRKDALEYIVLDLAEYL